MAGLMDFFATPEGQGLLAAGFGGLAGARRGQPLNSIGRGGLAGLAGYANAQEQQTQDAQRVEMNKDRDQNRALRQMQMDLQTSQLAKQKGEEQWRAGLPAVRQQATQTTYGAGDEGPTMTKPNPNALREYAMQPNSPFADEVMKSLIVSKPQEAFTLGEGQVRYGPDGKIVAQGAPKAPGSDAPTKVKEYEYAVSRGYKGTFDQYVSIGPTITAGAMAGLRDAQISNINAENAYNLPPPIQAPRPTPSPAGGASVSVGGKTYTFPNAAAAAAFKKQAGIQ